ncbi:MULTISPECIES: response regulator [Anaerotruncus]|jgi:two-component system KDP operon response regulator KdpE|uniref:response regulator n=1 Tax=Anaerotruncus TaxID=244127 RepID=UPI00082F54AF|nr:MULTISPECIES: response regulator [Anaerotruncus]RGX57046.1 DNA-binding response regulator [Anaerotruncus sp. AF02-27]
MSPILIVEDDKSILNVLTALLKTNGYESISAVTGLDALSAYYTAAPCLVLLDLGLPDIDGTAVLQQIRQHSGVPVIVISARGQESEKVAALDMGADDYVTKPFAVGELLARIRVALRKHAPRPEKDEIFVLDTLKVDFERRKVYVEGNEIHLTPIEYRLLTLLIRNRGKVLTHRFISKEIWGYEYTEDFQSLRVFMAGIRRKIEKDTTRPRYILTEVGVGYRFVDE